MIVIQIHTNIAMHWCFTTQVDDIFVVEKHYGKAKTSNPATAMLYGKALATALATAALAAGAVFAAALAA